MLKNNLLFTKYTNFMDCLFEFEYMEKDFQFVHTKINTCSNENEYIERLSCFYLHVYDKDLRHTCVTDLVLKNKNAILFP